MGQGKSKERYQKAVKKLSTLELDNIEAVFQELSTKTDDGTRRVELSFLTRQDFAERFHLTGFVAERLFHAFDKTESGTIDLDEFVGGIALCLHGSVRDKCRLLFRIFDLDEDDGVSKDELTAVLLSSLESAEKILNNIDEDREHDLANPDNMDKLIENVTRIVQEAFEKCDIGKTGKLSAKEFEQWLHKNPNIMDNVFGWQCPKPEEGQWMNKRPDSDTAKIGIFESPSPRNPSPFSQLNESTKDSRKLSDLFNVPSKTSEGQTFFDTFKQTTAIQTEQTRQAHETQVDETREKEENSFQSHEILQETSTFQEQPLVSDQVANKNVPTEPPHKSLEDIVKAQTQPGLLVGETSTSQSYQFVQQPFPMPLITQHHLQDASDPPETFQPTAIPVTPTHQQTMKLHPGPLQATHSQPEKPSNTAVTEHGNLEENVHSPAQTSSDVELDTNKKISEIDKLTSAWIPTSQTSQLLTAVSSGLTSKEQIDQQFLTSPEIVIDEPQFDPVRELLFKYSEEQDLEKRQTLSVDSVPLNESGLRELLASECWRAALEFTSRFLTAHGQGIGQHGQRALHTHRTLQVWFCRIALLYKLQMYSTAVAELEAFKDFNQPDLFYEFYPETYPGRKGCMVPFSLRILQAELPQHIGKPNEALDRLYSLQRMCQTVMKNLDSGLNEDGTECLDKTDNSRQAAVSLWKERNLRVLYAIGNCFLAAKDYNLAVSLFESIIKQGTSNSSTLYSGIGRIYLQLGDLERAEAYFKQVEESVTGDPENMTTVVMNKGFMSLSRGHYEEAHKHFVAATKLDPENSVATNNVAVCLLFLGKLKEALQVLESIIWSNPPKNLNDGLLFNLCTIYELESSWSMQKKHKLLELVSQYKGDGFNVSCLKIS